MTKSPKVLLKNWTPYEEIARHDSSTRFVPGPHQKALTDKESIFIRFGKPKPI